MADFAFDNPFRPGAGQMPPYLAGRAEETEEFRRLLRQKTILENMILTGLRGVGKTVLLETFKPIAIRQRWLWAGTDLSEAASVSEEALAMRMLTDLAPVTSSLTYDTFEKPAFGFGAKPATVQRKLGYETLVGIFNETPGLNADKLKRVLETVWYCLRDKGVNGLIFAYDEAQNMSDRPSKEEYPLALLLDVFQSIQRKDIPFMLALTGLPTLFPKLVESRTFSERMFRVVFLGRLTEGASRDAILKPMEKSQCAIHLTEEGIGFILSASAGYPYFIQFICREIYDILLHQRNAGRELSVFIDGVIRYSIDEIIRKLDADFFAGRWARSTDRQRELLWVISTLENCDEEFTVLEVVERSRIELSKPFGASHVNQMLSALAKNGLVYKNRHGKYSFAVPLFGQFILRQSKDGFQGHAAR